MISVLCYIEQNGKYLMLHRNKREKDLNGGKWIGVGGKVEHGESPEEALFREVKEETGLTVRRYRRRGVVTFVQGDFCEYMFLFTVDRFEGTLIECDEGDLHWVDKTALSSLPMWEGDRYFLDLLTRGAENFSLKLCYDGDRLISAEKY